MERKAFFFDSDRCVGCKTCMVACHKKNNLPEGVWYRHVTSYETGTFPAVSLYHLSLGCQHCEHPACIAQCPTKAMYRDEADGTVQHNDDICIGCGSCVIACPYDAPVLVEELGIAKKCNACIDTREADGVPTCVAACGTRALDFGAYDELAKRHPNAVDKIAPMPSADITHPSIFIKGEKRVQDESFHGVML